MRPLLLSTLGLALYSHLSLNSMGNKIVANKKAKALSSSELRKKKKERMGEFLLALRSRNMLTLAYPPSSQEGWLGQ